MTIKAVVISVFWSFTVTLAASFDSAFTPQDSSSLPPLPIFRTEQFQNHVPILRYSNDVNEGGNYKYAYETGNGISVQETGHFSPSAPEGGAVVANGGFSFTGTDGQTYSISYVADEYGFRPVGAHIPTPPPIPEAIARSLSVIARSSSSAGDNGQYQPNFGDNSQYQPSFGSSNQYQPNFGRNSQYQPNFGGYRHY